MVFLFSSEELIFYNYTKEETHLKANRWDQLTDKQAEPRLTNFSNNRNFLETVTNCKVLSYVHRYL